MALRYSHYNHLLTLGEGEYLLYNFLSGKQMRLDDYSLAYFQHVTEKEENEYSRLLQKKGFLVDYDEVEFLRVKAHAVSGGGSELKLVLCPTMACNLRCGYCFESEEAKRAHFMSEEVQNALCRAVEQTLQSGGYKSLTVNWYGGEPLLGFDVIEKLSVRFLSLCEKLSVAYFGEMISNGTLLTAERAERLYELGVRNIQITLDGPKAIHDASRPAKSGESSFDAITENLRSLRTPLKIDLRCNLHRDNAPFLRELEKLSENLNAESGAEIRLYTAGMKAVSSDPTGVERALPPEQFAVEGRPVDENMLECRSVSCGLMGVSVIIMDSAGRLYKCEGKVGIPEESYGSILDCKGDWTSFLLSDAVKRGVLSRWMSLIFPEDEECLACKVLPLCMGGCPSDRLDGRKNCNRVKYDMDSYVRLVTNIEQVYPL